MQQFVIRSTGGNNADHTVVTNNKIFAMHLLLSNIREDVKSLINLGIVCDLKMLTEEIEKMKEAGIKIDNEFFAISDRYHIIENWMLYMKA